MLTRRLASFSFVLLDIAPCVLLSGEFTLFCREICTMNPEPPKFRKWKRIAFWALVFMAVVVTGYITRARTEKGRYCRICAATNDHWNVFALGMPIWAWETKLKPTADTRNYFDQYLAYPHDHEWTGGDYAKCWTEGVACGRSSFGPYPNYQRRLTTMGFRLVAASGIQDPKQRRDFFENIIKSRGTDAARVFTTFNVISEQISKKIRGEKSCLSDLERQYGRNLNSHLYQERVSRSAARRCRKCKRVID